MFVTRVDIQGLSSRLDAGFYHPEYLSLDDRLSSLGAVPLHALVEGVSCGPFGGNAIAEDLYAEEGVCFIRPLNITSNVFDDTSLVRVPKELLSENDLKVYSGKNLYFGRVGVPCVAVIDGETSISPNIIIARVNESFADPEYLYAFCSSRYGLTQLKRQLKEVAQPTTSTDTIRFLKIFTSCAEVQEYIGDKVRQAEQLRARAKLLVKVSVIIEALLKGLITEQELVAAHTALAEGNSDLDKGLFFKFEGCDKANEHFTELVKGFCWESVDAERESFHLNRIKAFDIEDFLTAQTYRPEITNAYKTVTELGFEHLQDLCVQPIRQGTTPTFSEEGKRCLKSKQTREIIIDDVGYETVDPSDPRNSSIVRLIDGDVVITRQGAGTIGRASIFTGDCETYITDSLFLIRIDKDKADPGYIVAYLRTYTGKRLIEKGVYGSTGQLNLAGGHVRNIPIFRLDRTAQSYIGDKIRLVEKLRTNEKALIRASKSIVESLIEGQLTEQQLINAKKALESGDNSLDLDILSRLTTKGLDGDGDPLFADLDQLYELLTQCQEMD